MILPLSFAVLDGQQWKTAVHHERYFHSAGALPFNAGHEDPPGVPSDPPAASADQSHPYLYTKEARRMTRDKVTPDYAAVLMVCSRYLGITPIQLHSEVAQLESEVVQVETLASASVL